MKAGNLLASELNITYVSHYGWNIKCHPPRKTYTSENLVKPGGFFAGRVADPLGGEASLVQTGWPHITDVCLPPAFCFLVPREVRNLNYIPTIINSTLLSLSL